MRIRRARRVGAPGGPAPPRRGRMLRRPPRPVWPALAYRLCPACGRAVPLEAPERYCINDGMRLLGACPRCGAGIGSPYARHCPRCGHALRRD